MHEDTLAVPVFGEAVTVSRPVSDPAFASLIVVALRSNVRSQTSSRNKRPPYPIRQARTSCHRRRASVAQAGRFSYRGTALSEREAVERESQEAEAEGGQSRESSEAAPTGSSLAVDRLRSQRVATHELDCSLLRSDLE